MCEHNRPNGVDEVIDHTIPYHKNEDPLLENTESKPKGDIVEEEASGP